MWIKSFWNNKTYILYWNDLNAISGDEIYSVWKVDTLKKSASSCCTNITQTFCDLSSIFKHDLNAGYDIEIYSVGNTSNFSAELIDYYPWLESKNACILGLHSIFLYDIKVTNKCIFVTTKELTNFQLLSLCRYSM